MDKRLDAELDRVTEQLNSLKKAKDYWTDGAEAAEPANR